MADSVSENQTGDERPRPRVIVTRHLPDAVEARMAELFDTSFNRSSSFLT